MKEKHGLPEKTAEGIVYAIQSYQLEPSLGRRIQQDVRDFRKEFNDFTGRTEKDIDALRADGGTLKADIETLKADVAVLKADVAVLKGSLKMVQWTSGLSIVLLGTLLASMLHLSGALPF